MLVSLENALSLAVEKIGGKAANLARLQHTGFCVPKSWVLTTDLYSELITKSPLVSELHRTEPLSSRSTAQMIAYLQSCQPPMELRAQLGELSDLFAVRSSATCEDGPTASFAGVHESYLLRSGEASLWHAVKSCFASLWTKRAQYYRQRLGLSHSQVRCAVLFCRMIEATSAGVAFTCEPRSGQRDCVTINAGPGLGDSVVSGSRNPQRLFLSYQTGRLTCMEVSRPSYLSCELALQLARECIRVHWAMGGGTGAQDIEWAYDGKSFFLLQSRPVTSLPRVTYKEVENQPVIWSNANLKDILPGVQRTLSWNLAQGSIRNIGLASVEAAGGEIPNGMEFSKRICGRAYLDMTALQWALYETFGLPPRRIIKDMGSQAPRLSLPPGYLSGKSLQRAFRGLKLLAFVIALPHRLPKAIKKLEQFSETVLGWKLQEFSKIELLQKLYELRDAMFEYCKIYQFVNVRSSLAMRLLQNLYRTLAPRNSSSLLSIALRGGEETVSAKQGLDLVHLASLAAKERLARDYVASRPRDPDGWRHLPSDSSFRIHLQRYLIEFGHRAVYELKLENYRWAEDPSYLLDQISVMMDAPPIHLPQLESHPLVRLLEPANSQVRESLKMRERAKSALVWALYPTRKIFLELGRRLVEDRKLDDRDDIFHWCWMDVECYLRDEWDGRGSREIVNLRKAEIADWEETDDPPDFFIRDGHDGPAHRQHRVVSPEQRHSIQAQLQGVGVSSGQVQGPARILREPHAGKSLVNGEILVAPSTDPGWTPLFVRAAGIVMEVGGDLSHGAIVAREFGLPAVVGLPGVLQKIRNGQEIVVDGDRGTVTILS